MADKHKINFYPKPAPPTNPRIIPFAEIQRLLAKAPAPPTHEPQHTQHTTTHSYRVAHGPAQAAIQCTNRGAHQLGQDTIPSEPAARSLQRQV